MTVPVDEAYLIGGWMASAIWGVYLPFSKYLDLGLTMDLSTQARIRSFSL